MNYPIWQDLNIFLSWAASASFSVYKGTDNTGELIYTGKAYATGDDGVSVRVNDICAPYVGQGDGQAIIQNFAVYAGSTLKETFAFYANWSYIRQSGSYVDYSKRPPHDPVSNVVTKNMPLVLTVISTFAPIDSVELKIGTLTVPIPITETEGFNVWRGVPSYAPAGAARLVAYDEDDEVLTEAEYVVTNDDCIRYALYYVNALGGWDVLAMRGITRQTDGYQRRTYATDYDNSSGDEASIHNYRNDITRTLRLHTGWLTQQQASRMHHLLGSTKVQLLDTTDPTRLIAVVIRNADCPYKIARDGMIDYELEVEIATDMMRL